MNADGNSDGQTELHLQWIACSAEQQLATLCQASPVKKSAQALHLPDDTACFDNLQMPLIEYRYHQSPPLSRKDINCPMDVRYRLG